MKRLLKRLLFVVPIIIWIVWVNVAEVKHAYIGVGFYIAFILSLFLKMVDEGIRTLAEMKKLLFVVPFIIWSMWINIAEVENASVIVGFTIALVLSLLFKIRELKVGTPANNKPCEQ